jgi:hypothetical protein
VSGEVRPHFRRAISGSVLPQRHSWGDRRHHGGLRVQDARRRDGLLISMPLRPRKRPRSRGDPICREGQLREVTPVLARGSRHISCCRRDRENMHRRSWDDSAAEAQASLHIGHPFRLPPHNNDQLPHKLGRGRPSCLRCLHSPADDCTEAQ